MKRIEFHDREEEIKEIPKDYAIFRINLRGRFIRGY